MTTTDCIQVVVNLVQWLARSVTVHLMTRKFPLWHFQNEQTANELVSVGRTSIGIGITVTVHVECMHKSRHINIVKVVIWCKLTIGKSERSPKLLCDQIGLDPVPLPHSPPYSLFRLNDYHLFPLHPNSRPEEIIFANPPFLLQLVTRTLLT